MSNSTIEHRKDTKKSVKNLTNHIENLSCFIDNIQFSKDAQLTNKLINNLVEYIEKDLPIFNDNYRKIIKSVCGTFNSPTGFYIPSILSAVSTAIGKNVTIQDCRGVKEKAALYMCIVAASGTGKTPAANWCMQPIKDIETEKFKAYLNEKTEAEDNDEIFKNSHSSLYITDATTEALVSNLSRSNSILYFRDELIGWLKDMNKYRSGGGSDDLLFMQIWNSNDTIRTERQTKSTLVENPYLNVLGGTQPKRLSEFTQKFATDSGFFQRILFAYPDAKIQDRTNKKEDKQLKCLYSQLITEIYNKCTLPNEIVLEISEAGNNQITDFVNNFIKKQQRLFHSNSLLVECLSKLETYILRFVLIFEMMDSDEIKWTGSVSDNSITKAISTVIYFYFNTQKIIHSSEQNSIYPNDSDRFIHRLLSSKLLKGIEFSTGDAIKILNGRYSKPTLNKHLKETGKYLYENLGRGAYRML